MDVLLGEDHVKPAWVRRRIIFIRVLATTSPPLLDTPASCFLHEVFKDHHAARTAVAVEDKVYPQA